MNKFGKHTEEDFEIVRDVVKRMVNISHSLLLARSQRNCTSSQGAKSIAHD